MRGLPRVLIAAGAAATALMLAAGQAGGVTTRSATSKGTPLSGTWDSGPFPMSRIRAAAAAAGYSPAVIAAFIHQIGMGNDKTVEVNAHFYRGSNGTPLVRRTGWDPTKGAMPSDGDWGPYKLRPHGGLEITTSDPGATIHDYFRYILKGKTLRLHALREVAPSFSAAKLRRDSIHLFFFSAVPLHKK